VTVALYSEPRRGEFLSLVGPNVDFDLNAINFTETKANRDRSVPMGPIVGEALLDLRDQAGDAEYLFTNPDTETRYTDIKKSFSAGCREAGITNFRNCISCSSPCRSRRTFHISTWLTSECRIRNTIVPWRLRFV
jgi:integrase